MTQCLFYELDGRSHPNMKTPSFVLVVIDMMNDSFERHEAFFGTDFEARLLPFQPMTLVVSGVNTHACVRTTVIDAYQRDFDVVVASDCIASYDDQHHEVTSADPSALREFRDLHSGSIAVAPAGSARGCGLGAACAPRGALNGSTGMRS